MALEPKQATAGTDDEENAELREHDNAFLDRRGVDVTGICSGDGTHDPGTGPTVVGHEPCFPLVPICPDHTRGLLGGLAVFQTRLAIRRDTSLEHVHADRYRRRCGVRLQRRGDAFSQLVSGHDAARG